ncbi:MAG: imidazole glycerol phosphate synthase subunit HisH [Clostridiaceae bacterium]|nr:imidazole glycerol phosphate synthase subunit HisH [Clostridiaceae bacterium]
MITVVDYDAGNLKSVVKALQSLGEECVVTREAEKIQNADKVILPGVGSFGDAMEKLEQYQLVRVIQDVIEKKTPFLGICLGLQLLFESSEESPGVKGLGILPGKVVRFPEKEGFKIPHMGWNDITIRDGAKLFQGVPQNTYVYFVHSYYLQAERKEDVAAVTDYITQVHASVEHDNVFACQFHPEKSGDAGLKILKNFCSL